MIRCEHGELNGHCEQAYCPHNWTVRATRMRSRAVAVGALLMVFALGIALVAFRSCAARERASSGRPVELR